MKRQVYILSYELNPLKRRESECFDGHTFVIGKESLNEEIKFRLALGCRNMRYYKIDKGVSVKESFY